MEIIILHSHLNPGGVTRIIESQVESLKNMQVKVVVGYCPSPEKLTAKGVELIEFAPLNYLENRKYSLEETNQIHDKITGFLQKLISGETILHVHNLNLGKNPVLTYIISQLAKKGVPVFNHAHDFAEDRPVNFQFLKEIIKGNFGEKLNDVLYPDLPNYHFGVLNSFDQKRLEKYRVKKERILWLPNPVTFETKMDTSKKAAYKNEICRALNLEENKLLVTYPVRVIKRKNIGEFILLSVLFKNQAEFVVTQPPKNPVEVELYKKWLDFVRSQKIQVVFEAGNKVSFEKLLIASDFCITTSYQEGFGMVYLEPWLLNTPVTGRDINFLTSDFKNDGLDFPALYNEINIPGFAGDFKDLDSKTQMQIITGINRNQIKKEDVFEQNRVLLSLFKKVDAETTNKNKAIINNNYSLKKYGIKLQNRYKKMVG